MKVFLVIDETNFYQPDFVAELVKYDGIQVVGCALVTAVKKKSDIERYIRRHWYLLSIREIVKLGMKKGWFIWKDFVHSKNEPGGFYSVRSVLESSNISYFKAKYNINREAYLSIIKAVNPDVVVSSNSLIFGDELLTLAKFCINRHSALLPAYGGLWPVFHAYACGEERVGVSVHLMVNKIDQGQVLAQEEIQIEKDDTIDTLYQKCFKISGRLVIDALKKISVEGEMTRPTYNPNYKPSYYGFPTTSLWKEFRKRNGRFI